MARCRFAALALGAGLFACAAVAGPAVSGAWIRVLPGTTPAAGYFTLANPAGKPIALVGARSPACGSLMLHMTHEMNGVAHMMMVDKVDVPAGGSFTFKPGGYHLMCMQPQNLKPGTSVAVTLTFADGSTLTANFSVRNAIGQ